MASVISGNDVVSAILSANSAGKKAAATKLRRKFILQQEEKGKDPVWVDRGIKAMISRQQNI